MKRGQIQRKLNTLKRAVGNISQTCTHGHYMLELFVMMVVLQLFSMEISVRLATMWICRETLPRVLRLSREEEIKEEKASEKKNSEVKKSSTITPSERDHYVYAAIIAEIGY